MLAREEEIFYAECGAALEQADHRSCGYLITGSVQTQAGLGSEKPALVEDATTMAEVIFKDPFQLKHFCDSMILYKPVQESHWIELVSPHEPKAD